MYAQNLIICFCSYTKYHRLRWKKSLEKHMESRSAPSVFGFLQSFYHGTDMLQRKTKPTSSEISGILQLSTPFTYLLIGQTHDNIVSRARHDRLYGCPSHFLPQRCLFSSGPPERLSHPPLDEAALPNPFLENELRRIYFKIRTLKGKLLQLLWL